MASLFSRALLRRPLTASTSALVPRAAATTSRASTSCRTPTSITTPVSFSSSLPRPAARRFYSSNNNESGSPPPPPPPPPPPKPSNIKFWPFLVVIALGSGGYVLLVNQRNQNKMSADKKSGKPSGGNDLPKPTFSTDDVSVVFVLGGPGAGKGTQCARLVKAYSFTHLSAGDLLRAEQDRPGSEFGQLIRDCIRDGAIVPLEVTVKLLENAMQETITAKKGTEKEHKFLIDGFPRKMDQAIAFEQAVCPAKLVLFYDCPEDELERRLLERGKTSGRADDNADSIRKRFRTFVETSMPVVDAYAKEGRVVKILATATPDAVFAETQKQLGARLSLE
ncbi:bifunctional uridylate/adenylate kinase [Sporothrix bragantina]|uniref:Uridylate kinase n=1 Tax=Sporothrix bragantina TaxID=671064 RepID=A0ABP0CK34_9PEZI